MPKLSAGQAMLAVPNLLMSRAIMLKTLVPAIKGNRSHGLAKAASGEWVFPGDKGDGPLNTDNLWRFWIAAMNGESMHVAGRLLGHRRASTINRYVHLDDSTLWQAAERLAVAIKSKLQPSTD